MTTKEALEYISCAVKEGYMTEEEARGLESPPDKEMIRKVKFLGRLGDLAVNTKEGGEK